VFQYIREVGNTFCLIHLMETVMNQLDALAFLQSSFFLGISRKVKPST